MKEIPNIYNAAVRRLKEKRQKPPDDIHIPQEINFLILDNLTDTSPIFIPGLAHVESIKKNWKPPPHANPTLSHINSE